MKGIARTSYLGSVVALVAAAALVCGSLSAADPTAGLSASNGAGILASGATISDMETGDAAQSLKVGDVVTTGAKAGAKITLSKRDKDVLRLAANTSVTITKWELSADKKRLSVAVSLDKGSLWADVNRLKRKVVCNLQILVGEAVLSGNDFKGKVALLGDGRYSVNVTRGTPLLQSGRTLVRLASGITVNPGPPTTITADPDNEGPVPAAYIDAIRHARQPRPLDSGRDQAAARAMPVPAPAATEAGHDPEARLAPLQAEYEFVADLPAEWLFFADEEALGFRLGYVEEDTDVSAWESIPISDCFQRFGHRFRGVAWYRTTFHVPKELEGRQVFLIFARVSVVHTWVNGRWANATVKHGCLVVNPNKRPSHRIRYGEENFVVVPVLTDGSPGGITGPVKLAVKKAQAGD